MNDVQFLVESGIGRITLNRPRALNSLNHGMVLAMLDHLETWRADPGVRAVLIDGAGSAPAATSAPSTMTRAPAAPRRCRSGPTNTASTS